MRFRDLYRIAHELAGCDGHVPAQFAASVAPVSVDMRLPRASVLNSDTVSCKFVPGRGSSKCVVSLREEAELLRNLAWSFDPPMSRDELFALAADCERLAKVVRDRLSAALPSVPHSLRHDGSLLDLGRPW